MYLPTHFRQHDRRAALELIERVALAELLTFDGHEIAASTIPMLFDSDASPEGSLLGHVARANPQWSSFLSDVEGLAIFRGPQSYISPSWYPTTAEHQRVVPTWNYATVHVRGALVVHDEVEWKRSLVARLTDIHEMATVRPWSLHDAPKDYVDIQLGAIVGIELRITSLVAKWKMSQNQPERNRAGVIDALEAAGTASGIEVATLIRSTSEARDLSREARVARE